MIKGGTKGSNPISSSGESTANLNFPGPSRCPGGGSVTCGERSVTGPPAFGRCPAMASCRSSIITIRFWLICRRRRSVPPRMSAYGIPRRPRLSAMVNLTVAHSASTPSSRLGGS